MRRREEEEERGLLAPPRCKEKKKKLLRGRPCSLYYRFFSPLFARALRSLLFPLNRDAAAIERRLCSRRHELHSQQQRPRCCASRTSICCSRRRRRPSTSISASSTLSFRVSSLSCCSLHSGRARRSLPRSRGAASGRPECGSGCCPRGRGRGSRPCIGRGRWPGRPVGGVAGGARCGGRRFGGFTRCFRWVFGSSAEVFCG